MIQYPRNHVWHDVILVIVIAAMVCTIGWQLAFVLALALPVLMILIFGPSIWIVSAFITYMFFSHQYYSPLTLDLGGVIWHPREGLLLLLLLHSGFHFCVAQARLPMSRPNIAFALLGAFVIVATLVGFLKGESFSNVIQEFRFGLFVVAYFSLLMLIKDKVFVTRQMGLLAGLTVGTAISSLIFFSYAMTTGNKVQLNQTPLGEVMIYPLGAGTVQMVRPNGHVLFELGIVLCLSLIACHHVGRRDRFTYALIAITLTGALMVTFMRTAYVSVAVSIVVLGMLMVPRRAAAAAFVWTGLPLLFAVVLLGAIWFSGSLSIGLVDTSMRGRLVEMEGAWNAFTQNPIVGSGFGSSFEGLGLVQSGAQLAAVPSEYRLIHNVWLYYLFKGGFVGFTLAGAALCGVWLYGYTVLNRLHDGFDRAVIRGLVAALSGYLISALAMHRLLYPQGYVFLALVAIVFVMYDPVILRSSSRLGGNEPQLEEN